ncbi:DUF2334 domain-containing protein [Petrimonas sp.]|uniref:DUF2334 domain-containing protein n=1 Tax=Petrimonas sp. TaxID=2023866 RepID=UPI002FCBB7F3
MKNILVLFMYFVLIGFHYGFNNKSINKEKKKVIVSKIQKPTFTFIFDDGLTSDVNVVNKFKEYGFKCGFAIIINTLANDRIVEYLEYQKQGFEILSHSITHPYFQGNKEISLSQAEYEFKNSLNTLTIWGFDVKGFVTPSSQMDDKYLPLLEKYYKYAYTVYYGQPQNPPVGHVTSRELHILKRLNLEGKDTDTMIMAEIDECITQNGILHFYAHKYPDNLTEARLVAILEKLKPLSESGVIDVLTPYEAIQKYYKHVDMH